MTWHEGLPGDALPPGSRVLQVEELALAPDPKNVGIARRWVVQALPEGVTPAAEDAVSLLTSELVTNGVVHARTELRIRLTVTEHDVLVGVHDLDLGHRELTGPERDGGRGLAILRAVASASGQVHHSKGGKTVWFRVPLRLEGSA